MNRTRTLGAIAALIVLAFGTLASCGSNGGGGGSVAQQHGVGAACSGDVDCPEVNQQCLPFKGGYCGVQNCSGDADCPPGSACVTHTDGKNYCFLLCLEKVDCNVYRPADAESNCSANVTFVNHPKGDKACVPPT